MKSLILIFLSFMFVSFSYAQDCASLDILEQNLDRLRISCSSQVKCRAGYSFGVGPEEAVKACVTAEWGSRNTCINHLTCEGIKPPKCNAGSHMGLTPAEAVEACVKAEWGNRTSCINYLKCENKVFQKCSAGYQMGLNMNEAVDACVASGFGSRDTCINYAKCTNN